MYAMKLNGNIVQVQLDKKNNTPVQNYKTITVIVEGEGLGRAYANQNVVETGGTVVLTAWEDEGFFVYWVIDGVYGEMEGDVSDTLLILKNVQTDIVALAVFSKEEDILDM